jgi:hypothetical protein
MVVKLCERFHCLPHAGGLLDQDAEFLRMIRIVQEGGGYDGE